MDGQLKRGYIYIFKTSDGHIHEGVYSHNLDGHLLWDPLLFIQTNCVRACAASDINWYAEVGVWPPDMDWDSYRPMVEKVKGVNYGPINLFTPAPDLVQYRDNTADPRLYYSDLEKEGDGK